MLIRLSATNFLSFNEETEFNMLSSSDQRSHKEHVYSRTGLELLKGAAIYGANGAGKSNFVKAVMALQMIVVAGGKSHLNYLEGFKLYAENDKPITIEIEFIKDGTPFLYGVSVQNKLIVDEWLYVSGLGKREDHLLFHRTLKEGKIDLEFAKKYRRTDEDRFRLKFYQDELLKNDELLLTELAGLKEGFEEIKQTFNWFKFNLTIIFPRTKSDGLAIALSSFAQFRDFANDYLCSSHTGIEQINVISTDLDEFFELQSKEIANEIRSDLHNGEGYRLIQSTDKWGGRDELTAVLENDKPVVRQIVTKHQNQQGQLVDFTLNEESDGTNRLLDFIFPFYGIIQSDSVVIIDEIDQSIHPALLKELVRKFMTNSATKGQLIFTTHESNLLDQNLFRRDEIWFVEKQDGATKMYPLSDFDIRLDLDIRKGYLNGRFGAIPFLGNLKDLNWE